MPLGGVTKRGGAVGRGLAVVRDATADDAEALVTIWKDFAEAPGGTNADMTSGEVRRALRRLEADDAERLVVAAVDEEPVGVAHLRCAPLSPIHEEAAIHVSYLHVLSGYRRRGLGQRMLEEAANWADETGSKNIIAAVAANARDSNRFLARLGLLQVAVVRAAPVSCLRTKLSTAANKPATTEVVAARRRMLRRRARTLA